MEYFVVRLFFFRKTSPKKQFFSLSVDKFLFMVIIGSQTIKGFFFLTCFRKRLTFIVKSLLGCFLIMPIDQNMFHSYETKCCNHDVQAKNFNYNLIFMCQKINKIVFNISLNLRNETQMLLSVHSKITTFTKELLGLQNFGAIHNDSRLKDM